MSLSVKTVQEGFAVTWISPRRNYILVFPAALAGSAEVAFWVNSAI